MCEIKETKSKTPKTAETAEHGGCSTALICSASLVQPAQHGHMTGGRRGGIRIAARPAKVSFGGVIWTSPISETEEEAEFFNSTLFRLIEAKDGWREIARESAIEIEKLRKALRFYADDRNWYLNPPFKSDVQSDKGDVAKDALDEKGRP